MNANTRGGRGVGEAGWQTLGDTKGGRRRGESVEGARRVHALVCGKLSSISQNTSEPWESGPPCCLQVLVWWLLNGSERVSER